MTKSPALVALIFLASACTRERPVLPGLEMSALSNEQRDALPQAIAEFDRVKQGQLPSCAPAPEVAYSDGGTVSYNCKHFGLVVRQSLAFEDGVPGYNYGPVLVFDGAPPVSDVKFYTNQQMSVLLKRRQHGR